MSGSRTRLLLVIQDGLGDRPLPELGGRTPLEAAATPNMDALARRGVTGLVDIVAPGVTVGTDVGHLVLFDQDIEGQSCRRGPLEAAGSGLSIRPGDVALRCNWATVGPDFRVRDRRAGRIREGVLDLVTAVEEISVGDGIEILFRPATEHRAALVLRGEGLSEEITDSDPEQAGRPVRKVRPRSRDAAAGRTARLVNRFVTASHEILKDHPVNLRRRDSGLPPANILLTRGAGGYRNFRNLPDSTGLRMACVSGECTVLGIARLAGVETVTGPAMTANLDTDLEEKAARAVQALQDFDLVYLHLKGCDIAGHDRRPGRKRKFIEQSDAMIGEILARVPEPDTLAVALVADHCTLCSTGEHSGDPVPVLLAAHGVEGDRVKSYSERSCAEGALGRGSCREFLSRVIQQVGVRQGT